MRRVGDRTPLRWPWTSPPVVGRWDDGGFDMWMDAGSDPGPLDVEHTVVVARDCGRRPVSHLVGGANAATTTAALSYQATQTFPWSGVRSGS